MYNIVYSQMVIWVMVTITITMRVLFSAPLYWKQTVKCLLSTYSV